MRWAHTARRSQPARAFEQRPMPRGAAEEHGRLAEAGGNTRRTPARMLDARPQMHPIGPGGQVSLPRLRPGSMHRSDQQIRTVEIGVLDGGGPRVRAEPQKERALGPPGAERLLLTALK